MSGLSNRGGVFMQKKRKLGLSSIFLTTLYSCKEGESFVPISLWNRRHGIYSITSVPGKKAWPLCPSVPRRAGITSVLITSRNSSYVICACQWCSLCDLALLFYILWDLQINTLDKYLLMGHSLSCVFTAKSGAQLCGNKRRHETLFQPISNRGQIPTNQRRGERP